MSNSKSQSRQWSQKDATNQIAGPEGNYSLYTEKEDKNSEQVWSEGMFSQFMHLQNRFGRKDCLPGSSTFIMRGVQICLPRPSATASLSGQRQKNIFSEKEQEYFSFLVEKKFTFESSYML
jgi:hypothetical protein